MNVNQYIKKIPTEQINRLMSLSGDVMISKEKQAKLKALYLAKFGKELTDDKLNELLARGALMLVQESMRRDDVVPAHAIEKDIGRDMDSD